MTGHVKEILQANAHELALVVGNGVLRASGVE